VTVNQSYQWHHTHSNITTFSSCSTTVQCYYGSEVSQSCRYP